MMELFQMMSPFLAAAAVVLAAYAAYRGTVKAKVIESEAAPYEKLSDRVGMLESQVEELMATRWIDRAYIRLLMDQWPYHKPLPLPMPVWITRNHQHPLDPSRFVEGPSPEPFNEDEKEQE